MQVPSGSLSTTWLSQILSKRVRGLLADMSAPDGVANEEADLDEQTSLRNPFAVQPWCSSHASAPRAAAPPVLKQACSRSPPVGASQSSISPAANTPGRSARI